MTTEHPASAAEREIFIAHLPELQPVTAVKNVLLQVSIAQLKSSGLFEQYEALVDPAVPAQILASLALSWTPIELALAHYGACENMMLRSEQLSGIGGRVGDRLQETSFVSAAKKTQESQVDVWSEVGAMHRMWARQFQGGSVQVAKHGPNDMSLELRGFRLNKFRYYREAQLAAIGAAYRALGVGILPLKIAYYSASRDELAIRIRWT